MYPARAGQRKSRRRIQRWAGVDPRGRGALGNAQARRGSDWGLPPLLRACGAASASSSCSGSPLPVRPGPARGGGRSVVLISEPGSSPSARGGFRAFRPDRIFRGPSPCRRAQPVPTVVSQAEIGSTFVSPGSTRAALSGFPCSPVHSGAGGPALSLHQVRSRIGAASPPARVAARESRGRSSAGSFRWRRPCSRRALPPRVASRTPPLVAVPTTSGTLQPTASRRLRSPLRRGRLPVAFASAASRRAAP